MRLRLAPEGKFALEEVITGLPAEVFATDDALGWVYQFWQKDKKDEINNSERKIGGADLGPVTQLFTENYMVRFLLENSLGAWWASHHPGSPLVKGFEYLRFDEDGKPAAGAFDSWPERVAEVTVMDPCCGSGHFLVEAFGMLWQMRVEEEGLTPVDAQDAVLRDNLFGLELDSRCVQIAMFAVALQAWKAGSGWRQLPVPNIACSGIPVKAPVEEWKDLAGGDSRLENALGRLHVLFRDADTLGSLIDPARTAESVDPTGLQSSFHDTDWEKIAPLLRGALLNEPDDSAVAVLGAAAAGVARAADFLSRDFTLVTTNPPFLGRGSQVSLLRDHCLKHFPDSEAELANVMAERWCRAESRAYVLPQNWLFMGTFTELRARLLLDVGWVILARLGPGAFEAISGQVVQTVLWITHRVRRDASQYREVSVETASGSMAKAAAIRQAPLARLSQDDQRANPESIVVAGGALRGPYVSDMADVRSGLTTGDSPAFIRFFWEVPALDMAWERLQSAPDASGVFSGCEKIILWEGENGRLAAFANFSQPSEHRHTGLASRQALLGYERRSREVDGRSARVPLLR